MSIPASPQAESALLSRLLVDPSQVNLLAGTLDPDDFVLQDHKDAWQAMIELSSDGRPIDLVTIGEVAGRELNLPSPDFTGTQRAPVKEYADILISLSLRRQVIEQSQQLNLASEKGDQNRMADLGHRINDLIGRIVRGSNLGLVNLEEFQTVPPPPLLGMLSPDGTTVLYGEGGDGKGWIATSVIRDLLSSGLRTLVLDFENHPSEWAYRLNRLGVPLKKVLYVEPSVTMDKWADARAERLVKSEDIGFIVVDSATYATNDSNDPYSPGAAMLYKRARAKLGNLPTLLLAHTPKGSDTIFGSVFFRNEARIVWRLTKDGSTRQRRLECKKDNVYGLEGAKRVVEFDEEQGVLALHPWGKPWTPQAVTA